MKTNLKMLGGGLMLSGLMMLGGCGGGDNTYVAPKAAPLTGNVVQGPVSGCTVVAKKSGNKDFSKAEAGEVTATTNASGVFTFAANPDYNYTYVILPNGTDTLTGKSNIQLIAKGGSANVTPLTTLVATDTTGTVEAKLVALAGLPAGSSIGAVNTSNTTPAAMIVSKSIESTISAITATVKASAGANTVSATQLAAVQSQTLQALATEVAKPATTAATLSAPSTLTASVNSAVAAAIPAITASNSNITVTAANVATIATAVSQNAVGSAVIAISAPAGVTTPAAASAVTTAAAITTASVIAESSKINTTTAAAIATAVAAATTTSQAVTTVAATPATYTPPTVTVVVVAPPVAGTGSTGGSN